MHCPKNTEKLMVSYGFAIVNDQRLYASVMYAHT